MNSADELIVAAENAVNKVHNVTLYTVEPGEHSGERKDYEL